MTEIEEKIQDAEIEISLAIGCLEWAMTQANGPINNHIKVHIDSRVYGLEKALRTIKELKAIALEEKADVHGSEQN